MTATMPLPDAVAAAPSRRSPGRRARADAVARTAAGAGLWLSLLLVALWWVRGGGVQALAGWESGLTSLGRLSGLVASDLLLAQVLLIARIPVLERAFGQDTLLRHHRIVGFTSFNLMLTHIGLITWGYAAGDLTATPGTFWNLTTTYPGMLLALAGSQCFTWRFLRRTGWTRGNPYSLSAAPDGRSLRISVKDLGDNSRTLHDLRPGTPVLVEGPYGRLSARARTRPRIALIGAGVGVTPLRALAEELDYAPGDAVLLQRFTDVPLFEREFRVLAAERGLELVWLPGHRRAPDSWLGAGAGHADDLTLLPTWVPDIDDRDVYVCGPEPWTDAVRRSARAASVPDERIHVEKFGW